MRRSLTAPTARHRDPTRCQAQGLGGLWRGVYKRRRLGIYTQQRIIWRVPCRLRIGAFVDLSAICTGDGVASMKGTRNKRSTVPGPLAPLEAVCAEAAADQAQTVTRGCTESSGSPLVAFGNLSLRSGTALSSPGLAGLLSRKFTQNTLVESSITSGYFSALRSYKSLMYITGGSWKVQVSPELIQKKFQS